MPRLKHGTPAPSSRCVDLSSCPRSELEASPRPPADLLDALLLSADEAGRGMGDQALRDELLTLLVAGACAHPGQPPARVAGSAVAPAHGRQQTWRLRVPPVASAALPSKQAPHTALPPASRPAPASAGQETSAIQLAWTCAYLAHHPAAQDAAAAEVAALLGGPDGRAPRPGDTRRLPFVEACVLESMR